MFKWKNNLPLVQYVKKNVYWVNCQRSCTFHIEPEDKIIMKNCIDLISSSLGCPCTVWTVLSLYSILHSWWEFITLGCTFLPTILKRFHDIAPGFFLHFLTITMSAWDPVHREALVCGKMPFVSLCAMLMWNTNLPPFVFLLS